MQFLTALLAFAAVMALMSTIVAVVIEAVINLFGMRTGGLRNLLQTYYRDAVAPRAPSGAGLRGNGAEAREFADAVMSNPARPAALGKTGPRRFNRLTTRQLIEQFARTRAGQAYLELSDDELEPHLEALAYEFDRYSSAASDFFTRRTRGVSVAIAFVLAFTLNIDAMRLYQTFLSDPGAREQVIQSFAQAQARQALADEQRGQGGAGGGSSLQGGAPRASGGQDANGDEPADALDGVWAQLEMLTSMSIPLGVSQYPYCSHFSPLYGEIDADSPLFDARCRVLASTAPAAATTAASNAPSGPVGLLKASGGKAMTFVGSRVRGETRGFTAAWFFSVLIAGGMIGLGAPFWFNVYRGIAAIIPVVGAASSLSQRLGGRSAAGEGGAEQDRGRRDDPHLRDGRGLVVTARTSGGQSPTTAPSRAVAGAPPAPGADASAPSASAPGASAPAAPAGSPPGVRIGDSSATRVSALAATGETGEAGGGMRRLRG